MKEEESPLESLRNDDRGEVSESRSSTMDGKRTLPPEVTVRKVMELRLITGLRCRICGSDTAPSLVMVSETLSKRLTRLVPLPRLPHSLPRLVTLPRLPPSLLMLATLTSRPTPSNPAGGRMTSSLLRAAPSCSTDPVRPATVLARESRAGTAASGLKKWLPEARSRTARFSPLRTPSADTPDTDTIPTFGRKAEA